MSIEQQAKIIIKVALAEIAALECSTLEYLHGIEQAHEITGHALAEAQEDYYQSQVK